MNIIKRIDWKLKHVLGDFYRGRKNNELQKKLTNTDFTIISSNCIGGILSHDLNQRFNSPTINLFFTAGDFVKFCVDLPNYLEAELVYKKDNDGVDGKYPVCTLKDIDIYFAHYKTFDECVIKWEERKKRIDFNNLFIIWTDRNNCTDELIEEFSKIQYKKIMFSHKPMPNYDFIVHVPGFERDGQVPMLNEYCDYKGTRYYEKYFDFVLWLNGQNVATN